MLEFKENQFNIVKENILPTAGLQAKPNQLNRSNALQPKMMITNVHNVQNQLANKPAGLKVSKQTTNSIQNENIQKSIQIPTKSNVLQAKSINISNQPAVSKGMQGKINAQKKNANERQSLKSIKNNEIVDGKIKKIERSKANSGSKLNRKVRKSNDINKKETSKNNEQKQQPVPKKDSDCDFVIFCDENDELAIKQVEKENSQEPVNKVEKKKGLAERNLKPQTQSVQVNLQTKTIQQQTAILTKATTVQQTTDTIQKAIIKLETINTIKANIEKELIKEAETLMSIDLSKDEELEEIHHQEITINSTIENKENDPTLMSIDQSCLNLSTTKEDELESKAQSQYKDVSGDMVVKEFSNEIYVYMLERELKFLPDPTYMSKQPDINHKMRAMLVDWLIDVGFEYELNNETVFLAVSYIDQFLSSLTISLQNFQLLGNNSSLFF